ncbi:MAG TPA: adenosylmethionine decarboxylase, partial [Exilispira sp.]|nr:adenosylmethionine decarboxylase [Exilispira sp.]
KKSLKKGEKMQALGRHILVEMYECNEEILNDLNFIEKSMIEATRKASATIVQSTFHKFSPHGVSGVIVIAESHVAIHTWPEYKYAAVDIFTCGETIDPWIIFDYLKEKFECEWASRLELKRGQIEVPEGIKLKHKPSNYEEI